MKLFKIRQEIYFFNMILASITMVIGVLLGLLQKWYLSMLSGLILLAIVYSFTTWELKQLKELEE